MPDEREQKEPVDVSVQLDEDRLLRFLPFYTWLVMKSYGDGTGRDRNTIKKLCYNSWTKALGNWMSFATCPEIRGPVWHFSSFNPFTSAWSGVPKFTACRMTKSKGGLLLLHIHNRITQSIPCWHSQRCHRIQQQSLPPSPLHPGSSLPSGLPCPAPPSSDPPCFPCPNKPHHHLVVKFTSWCSHG